MSFGRVQSILAGSYIFYLGGFGPFWRVQSYVIPVRRNSIGTDRQTTLRVYRGCESKQGDVTCAFLHADLGPEETVYVEMPLGFNVKSKNGKRQVLKLNKTLYGLRQSPRAF